MGRELHRHEPAHVSAALPWLAAALLLLAARLDLAPGQTSIDDIEALPLLETTRSDGLRLTVAGYHQDRPHMLSVHRDCRLERWIGPDTFAHECDATFGASGAPILTESNGSFGITGVHIGFLEKSGAEKAQVRGIGVAWAVLARQD